MLTQASNLYHLLLHKWVLMLILLVCSFITIDQGHAWGDDFALYISQAVSLLDGSTDKLYETNKFAMDYSDRLTGPYLYPIGTSVLLAPVIKLLGINYYALKLTMLIFWMGSLYLIYIFFLLRTKDVRAAAFIVICIGLHPQLVIQPDTIGSDIPFLFFTFLFFTMIQKNTPVNRYLFYFQLGLLTFIAVLFRSIGIAFLPVIMLLQWNEFKKDSLFKNGLFIILPYATFFILLKMVSSVYNYDSGSYLQYLMLTNIQNVLQNIVYYIQLFATYPFNLWELVSPYIPVLSELKIIPYFIYTLSAIIFSISMYGLYERFKQNADLIIFTAVVLGIYIIWPSKQGYRFIIPLLPIYVYFLWNGCLALKHHYHTILIQSLPILIVVIIGISGIICSLQFKLFKNTDQIHTTTSKELYTFIVSNTNPTDILCFFKPRILRLETGRNAIRQYTDEQSLVHSKADYYITYRESPVHYKGFQLAFKNTDFAVYKINR